MEDISIKTYPNVTQSFGIAGINIVAMVLTSPLMYFLKGAAGLEVAFMVCYIIAAGGTFAIVYFIRKGKTGDTTFPLKVEKQILPFIMLATLALLFGIIMPLGSFIPMPDNIKKTFLELGVQTGIFAFITMVIAAPIFEELIFRGIILDGLLKKYTPRKSILISSLIFGLVHLNPWQFIAGFTIGVFAGWVYYNTRSLTACIIIHATANLSGYLLRFFVDVESLVKKHGIETYGNLTNLLAVIAGGIVVIAGCVWYLQKYLSQEVKTELG